MPKDLLSIWLKPLLTSFSFRSTGIERRMHLMFCSWLDVMVLCSGRWWWWWSCWWIITLNEASCLLWSWRRRVPVPRTRISAREKERDRLLHKFLLQNITFVQQTTSVAPWAVEISGPVLYGLHFHPSKITSRSSLPWDPAAFSGKRRTNTIIYDTNDPPDSDPLSFPSLSPSRARAAPTWGQSLLATSSKALSSCWWTADQRLLGHETALKWWNGIESYHGNKPRTARDRIVTIMQSISITSSSLVHIYIDTLLLPCISGPGLVPVTVGCLRKETCPRRCDKNVQSNTACTAASPG